MGHSLSALGSLFFLEYGWMPGTYSGATKGLLHLHRREVREANGL